MIELLFGYGLIAVLWLFVCAIFLGVQRMMDGYIAPDMRGFARALFMAPVWPLAVAYAAYLGIRTAWVAAGFGGKK